MAPKAVFLCTGEYTTLTIDIFSIRLRGAFVSPILLSIHAVLAGSDAHLAKAFSSVIGGHSSLKTLKKNTQRNHLHFI